MGDARRTRAEEALAEGRRLLASGEVDGALRLLDRARKDFVKEADLGGLRDLRKTVEDGYRDSASADEPGLERLLYASAQNIRFLSRRRAAAAGMPWEDPHPELDQPGRPEMRAERGLGRRDVPWIVLGVLVAAALVAGLVALIALGTRRHERSIVNDSGAPVLVGLCDSPCDSVAEAQLVQPGERVTYRTNYDRFAISKPSGKRLGCVDATRTARTSSAAGC